MAGFVEVRPRHTFDFAWEGEAPVTIAGPTSLKALIQEIARGSTKAFAAHLKMDGISRMLAQLAVDADFAWGRQAAAVCSHEEFLASFRTYLSELQTCRGGGVGATGAGATGITESWFRCMRKCRDAGHAVVINSFGVDTQEVVRRSAPSRAGDIVHVTMNFEMWSDRDAKMFAGQFDDPPTDGAAAKRPRLSCPGAGGVNGVSGASGVNGVHGKALDGAAAPVALEPAPSSPSSPACPRQQHHADGRGPNGQAQLLAAAPGQRPLQA